MNGHEPLTRTQEIPGALKPRERIKLGSPCGSAPVLARVLRQQGRRLLLLLPPRAAREEEALAAGRAVQIVCRGKDAGYLRAGKIQSHPSARRLFVLLDPTPPERVQQRQHFRLPVRFPLMAEPVEQAPVATAPLAPAPVAPAPPAGRLSLLSMRNLSGGGCLCRDPEGRLSEGQRYRLHLCLPDGDSPLPVSARVVRRARLGGQGAAGLQFVDLAERDRERIMRTLFDEYRRRRSLLGGF
jgi:c-di-GMP-binding flagellar brake protein YcgR